ncbi:hypothetical protein [Pelagibacterium halotolerans]|uniref:hypothetical protein n=1 Tax=Pelagibacterium halotolerans TaxID=531813 RepID=UPI00384F3CB7
MGIGIEHIMYAALGFLAAGLLAVAIVPAIWNRAVRLTKRRIEAVTPVTLNEFRADKDKLRAEFAIATRRLEMRIERLRNKLVDASVAIDSQVQEIAALKAERDEQYDAISALKVREQELVAQIRNLERDAASLAAMVDRQAPAGPAGRLLAPDEEDGADVSGDQLTGDYRSDVEDLLIALSLERQRNAFLEEQAEILLARLDKKKKRDAASDEAIALLRDTLAKGDPSSAARLALHDAEARIANAEARLSALLSDSEETAADTNGHAVLSLADELGQAERLDKLKDAVLSLEKDAARGWGTKRYDPAALRERLKEIANETARLVYSEDAREIEAEETESLFDRVRKFAGDGVEFEDLPLENEQTPAARGAVADRLAALRNLQER